MSDEVFPYRPSSTRSALRDTDLSVLDGFEVRMSADYTDSPYEIELAAEFDPEAVAWNVTSLTARQEVDGPAVTTERLREVAVGFALNRALHVIPDLIQTPSGSNWRDGWDNLRAELTARRSDGPTPENLRSVAQVYRVSAVMLDAPIRMVQVMFGMPDRSASHWAKLARERGHLQDLRRGSNGEY